MDATQHGKIASLIWGIADDLLRDLYVRGKYRDVILPFTVLRRLDSVLEPSKRAVGVKQTLRRSGLSQPGTRWSLRRGVRVPRPRESGGDHPVSEPS